MALGSTGHTGLAVAQNISFAGDEYQKKYILYRHKFDLFMKLARNENFDNVPTEILKDVANLFVQKQEHFMPGSSAGITINQVWYEQRFHLLMNSKEVYPDLYKFVFGEEKDE